MTDVINAKDLKKYAVEYADAQLEKEAQADLQKSVIETAAEKLGMSKGDFKQYADLYYKCVYKPEAFAKIEDMAEKADVVKNL